MLILGIVFFLPSSDPLPGRRSQLRISPYGNQRTGREKTLPNQGQEEHTRAAGGTEGDVHEPGRLFHPGLGQGDTRVRGTPSQGYGTFEGH